MNKLSIILILVLFTLYSSCSSNSSSEKGSTSVLFFKNKQNRVDSLALIRSEKIVLKFSIKSMDSHSNYKFREVGPPMPLLLFNPGNTLAIYQTSDNTYRIGKHNIPMEINEWTELRLNLDLASRLMTIDASTLDQQLVDSLKINKFGNILTIGKGFKERYWTGAIKDFKLSADGKQILAF